MSHVLASLELRLNEAIEKLSKEKKEQALAFAESIKKVGSQWFGFLGKKHIYLKNM